MIIKLAFNLLNTKHAHYAPAIVEIDDACVVAYKKLTAETANTRWIGGTAEIKEEENGMALFQNDRRIEATQFLLSERNANRKQKR